MPRNLKAQLEDLRQALADAAQHVIDEWQQDEEGFDEEYGSGGVCDAVANAMSDVIAMEIDDVELEEGGQPGDDHAFIIVSLGKLHYVVDLPPSIYEIGGGYSWRKRDDVVVDPVDIVIERVELEDD